MSANENFWIKSAPQWENRRYQSLLSGLFFSSLRYRRNYLLFILNQLPEGTRVLELGCGSGLLYSELAHRQKLQYTGVDISPEAIATAKKYFPEAEWLCDQAESIKEQSDHHDRLEDREGHRVRSGGQRVHRRRCGAMAA